MKKHLEQGDLARQLARIFHMDREDLMRWWRKLYGCEPVPRMGRRLMMLAIAYKIQEQALGGLRPGTKRQLMLLAKQEDNVLQRTNAIVTSGTRLIREWHGYTYEVTVLEKGVLFQGKQYRSLTEVARIITGSHWSGPEFFGLKRKKGVIRS